MRAVAILLVMEGHSRWILRGMGIDYSYAFFDGVDIFFVLSGFLIGGIILRSFSGPKTTLPSRLLTFLKRRWWRTLPNYYLVLVLQCIWAYFQFNGNDWAHFDWRFLLFAQNLAYPFTSFFWESWSLAVEEWFYLIFPSVFVLLLYLTTVRRAFLWATLSMIVIPLALRIFAFEEHMSVVAWDTGIRKVVIYRLDAIAYGLLAAWCFHFYAAQFVQLRHYLLAVGLALSLVLFNIDIAFNSYFGVVVEFGLHGLAIACFLPWLNHRTHIARGIDKLLTGISKTSYSLYLIHLGLIGQVLQTQFELETTQHHLLAYLGFWSLSFGFAYLLYRYFEIPTTRLRD